MYSSHYSEFRDVFNKTPGQIKAEKGSSFFVPAVILAGLAIIIALI